MVLCKTKQNEICTLRNENLYFAKWNLYFAKWNSLLCEMKICTSQKAYCTLRNGTLWKEMKWNLYFAKWKSVLCKMKSVLCEMKIFTLRNKNLYFAEGNLYFNLWNENADLKTWDSGQKENNFSELVCRELLRRNKHWALCFLHHCLRLLVDWLCFVLLRDNYINFFFPHFYSIINYKLQRYY